MNDLKKLENNIIKSIKEDSSGKSAFAVIKFNSGAKLHIISYLNGNEGVAQLDIDTGKLKTEDIIGKKVISIVEEFDGESDHLIIKLSGGYELLFTAFSSSPDSTASLKTSIYSGKKIVAESLEENNYIHL